MSDLWVKSSENTQKLNFFLYFPTDKRAALISCVKVRPWRIHKYWPIHSKPARSSSPWAAVRKHCDVLYRPPSGFWPVNSDRSKVSVLFKKTTLSLIGILSNIWHTISSLFPQSFYWWFFFVFCFPYYTDSFFFITRNYDVKVSKPWARYQL